MNQTVTNYRTGEVITLNQTVTNYRTGEVRVWFDPAATGPEAFVERIATAGFRVLRQGGGTPR